MPKTRARTVLTLALLLASHAAAQSGNDESTPGIQAAPAAQPAPGNPSASQGQGFTFSLPTGATRALLSLSGTGLVFVPGSARLDDAPLPDPVRLQGGLGWLLAGESLSSGPHRLSVTLSSQGRITPGLAVKYQNGRTETIGGTQPYSEPATPEAAPEESGLIRNVQAGLVLSDRQNLTVVVQGRLSAGVTLNVNGQDVPAAQVGRRAENRAEDTLRLDFIGVPLRTGANTLTATSGNERQSLTVYRAGPAQALKLEALQAVADSVTPITVRVTVLDDAGRRASLPNVTVSAPDLTSPDSDPQQADVQLALQNGQGTVTLRPRSVPGVARLSFEVNGHHTEQQVTVRPDAHTTLIGRGSIELSGLGKTPGDASLSAGGAVTLETPLAGGQLTVLADGQGLHDDASLSRPALGDASSERRTLQADGALAARYDRPGLSAQYARNAAPDPVFLASPVSDSLQVTTRSGKTSTSLTLTPGAGGEETALLPLGGTRVAHLPQNARPDSARLTLITRAAGQPEVRALLRPGFDYTVNDDGLIVFGRTPALQDTTLEATYRLKDGQGGVAVTTSVTRHWEGGSASAGISSVPGADLSAGARVQDHRTVSGASSDVDAALLATGSGVHATVQASLASNGPQAPGSFRVSLTGTHQSAGYFGVLAAAPGTAATLTASRTLTPVFSVSAQATLSAQPGQATRATVSADVNAALSPITTVRAGLQQTLLPEAQTALRAGLHSEPGAWVLDAAVQQAVIGSAPGQPGTSADLKASYRLALPGTGAKSELRFGVRSHLELSDGQLISVNGLILEGRNGPLEAAVNYDLPTLAGEAGVARFGVNASWPISRTLSLSTAASLQSPKGNEGWSATLSNDLHGLTRYGQWTAGLDLVRVMSGPRFALRAGYALSSENAQGQSQTGARQDGLTLSSAGSLLAEGRPEGTGVLLNLSAAARRSDLNSYVNVTYKAGTLGVAGRQELTLGSGLSLHAADHELRLGLGARLDPQDKTSLVVAPSASARLFLTPELSAGAAYSGLYQPSTGTWNHAYGIEAGYTFLPGTTFSVGYNLAGFTGFGRNTRPGVYLRLDLSGAAGDSR